LFSEASDFKLQILEWLQYRQGKYLLGRAADDDRAVLLKRRRILVVAESSGSSSLSASALRLTFILGG
jgi:hypothetical protein